MFKIPQKELLTVDQIQLSKVEEAASLCFRRKERFVEGFSCHEELVTLLNEYFGNLSILYSQGLVSQFKKLKEKVVKNGIVGLILAGVNNTTLINRYTQQDRVNILNLTIASICRTLIRQHFNEEELINLCASTPNFQIYYIKEDEEIETLTRTNGDIRDRNTKGQTSSKNN